MRPATRERVLTLPYAGLRGLGPLRHGGVAGQLQGPAAGRAPAHRMSDEAAAMRVGPVGDVFAGHGLDRLVEQVSQRVSADRFAHVARVARLALDIADANGFSAPQRQQVITAALLHDAARDMTDDQLLRLAPPVLELERHHPLALHGRAARALAVSWGVTDPTVLDAVEGHVFGVRLDDLVGMALYVADVSEPHRGVNDDIRQLAMTDLLAAYRLAVRAKVAYLKRCGKEIHPDTLAAFRAIVASENGPQADAPRPGPA